MTAVPLCKDTGKKSYASQRQARQATKRVRNRFGTYFCDYCHGFHVTGQIEQKQKRPGGGQKQK